MEKFRRTWKHLFPLFALSTALILGSPSSVFAASDKGGEHSGGGSYRELQFRNIGYEIVDILSDSKNIPSDLKRIPLKKLRKAIDTTRVEATDLILRPSPDGKPEVALIKDALNTPGRKLIQFNLDSWDLIPTGSRRAALVLHEYLGILHAAGVPNTDDRGYKYSRHLYEHSALTLWFDNTEIAQSITENVKLDFPVSCSYQYANSASIPLGVIGRGKTADGGDFFRSMMGRNITEQYPKDSLMVFIFDEAGDFFGHLPNGEKPKTEKTGLRVVVGYSGSIAEVPKTPIFSQSTAISPNMKFAFDLPAEQLHVECHRVRMTGLTKPTDFEP